MDGTCWGLATRICWDVELPVTCGKNNPRWARTLYCAILIAASAACRLGLWSTDCLTSSLSNGDLNADHQRAETSAPETKCWPATRGPPGPGWGEASFPGT